MENIFGFLEKHLDPSLSNILILVVIIFYIMYNSVTKSPDFIESLGYFKLRKIKKIEYAITSENIDQKYKTILKDDYSILQTSRALSIAPDKFRIVKAIKIYEIIGKYCTFREVYLALDVLHYTFYEMEINDIKVQLKNIKESHRKSVRNIFLFIFSALSAFSALIIFSNDEMSFDYFYNIDFGMLLLMSIMMATVLPKMFIANISAINVLTSIISIKNEQEASQDTSDS